MTIITRAVRLVDKEECVWVFWQPKTASRLGLPFDQPIPEGAYQMYHHDLSIWTALPKPTRPILVLPGCALLWRRAGVTTMPELESWITLTAHNATPVPDIPNLPSRIEPFFTRKSLATGFSFKAALGLITSPTKSRKPQTPKKPARHAPSLIITPRPRNTPKRAQTAPSSPRVTSSPTSSQLLSSPTAKSSPPAPSQLLRDVFGDDWKARIPSTSTSSTSAGPSTLKRRASLSEPEMSSKRPRHETVDVVKGTEGTRKKIRRPFIPPADVIEISDDEDNLPPKRKGKAKAKERKPIPADAEIIEISD